MTNTGVAARKKPVFVRIMAGAMAGAVAGAAWSLRHDHSEPHATAHSWREWLANFEHAGFPPGMVLSMFLLVAFSVYWDIAAKNSSETKTVESPWSRGIHLTLISLGQGLLLLPVPGLRVRFLPSSVVLVAVGLALEVAGVLFAIWARRSLGRNWSGAVAIKVDQQLVRSGPYRFVRHPIYTGVLGLYAGIAVVSGEAHTLVGLVLICLAYWRKIRLEEQYLGGLFGPAYDDYRNSTRAVIPGVL